MRIFSAVLLAAFSLPAWAAHGYALWGELKYPPGFAHFDYVNPTAPKGGEIRLVGNSRASTFDKYNPFGKEHFATVGIYPLSHMKPLFPFVGIITFEQLLDTLADAASFFRRILGDNCHLLVVFKIDKVG